MVFCLFLRLLVEIFKISLVSAILRVMILNDEKNRDKLGRRVNPLELFGS